MSTETVALIIDKKTKEVISRTPETVKINVNEIPKYQMDALSRTLIRSTTEYFKRPGVQVEYEQWLEEREAKSSKL